MQAARFAAFIVAGALLSGCAALGSLLAGPVEGMGAAFEEMGDYEAAARKAPGDLSGLDMAMGFVGDHADMHAIAAKNFGGYAFGFVEPVAGPLDPPDKEAVAKAKAWYRKGREAGLRALRRLPAFAAAEGADIEQFGAALGEFGKDDVPGLFWTAYNWGQLVMLSKDEPELVAELPRVLALIDRVKQLDAGYYHGGAHAFEMVNAASRPQLLGGQPEVARAAHAKAIAVDGLVGPEGPARFMTHDVMFAQFYAVQVQDADLFRKTLTRVLETPADVLPAARLANVIAKRRAQVLLAKITDFFPDLEEEDQ
ncbi:MAG: hypothetical protein FJZ01_01450 [Candidatus Sericytochromatia bacterium]|nr:hypothetical protein [Candidatus Tanganyikabacteria bacterium]